ncbi:copper resistance CopC family protein [Massilia sp. TS11]|uniref:copper resistance CopC family protein n=1 Tax=Massilia sp. TS11 TaxID=2908003 RepID=UPI001EDB1296|nr:copper resistance CopC family protein [Massilia sp. TS11]MCG2583917.1 copper resistance protein CopC [Massilia sp. TS11]
MIRTLFAGLLLLIGMGAAQAHGKLEAASPAANAQLDAAPKEISLRFNEVLEPAFSNIALSDAQAKALPLPPATIEGKTMRTAVPVLGAGSYTVRWSAMTRDGHKVKGEYRFSVR